MAKNYFGISDKGRVRDNNEDTFITAKVLNDEFILACVIDGVGGYEGGEVAAAIAKEVIETHFRKASGDKFSMMNDALVAVNANIHRAKLQDKGNMQMACVLTLALVSTAGNQFYYAHVGDTRLYLLRDHSLVKITKDHSFVGFLEDSGRLTEAQAMKHPKRNEINKALGFDAEIGNSADYIETGESPFLPGDILLVCSDGLTDMVSNSEITAVLTGNRSLEQKGRELVDAANERGGKDNITVALVYHDGNRKEQEVTRPAIVKKNDERNETTLISHNSSKGSLIGGKQKSNHKGWVIFLALLSMVLTAALIWSLTKNTSAKSSGVDSTGAVTVTADTTGENTANGKLLADSLRNAVSGHLILNDSLFGTTIVLGDTLLINHDSAYIGSLTHSTIRAAKGYTGPAVVLSNNSKWVLLENITFEDFETGIVSRNKALQLKNVKFINTSAPVVRSYTIQQDVFVNGGMIDTAVFVYDSLPKKY